MNAQELRAIQAPFKQRYQEHPETAWQTLTAVGQIDLGAMTVKFERVSPSWNSTGMHPLAGGDGTTACAAEMLLHALIGCAGVTFAAVSTAMEIPIQEAKIVAEGDLDFRGTLGVSRDVPVGFAAIRIRFLIDSAAPDAKLAKLVELSERYCVVAQTLKSVTASWERTTAG